MTVLCFENFRPQNTGIPIELLNLSSIIRMALQLKETTLMRLFESKTISFARPSPNPRGAADYLLFQRWWERMIPSSVRWNQH